MTTKTRPEDCATAWFAVLERARMDGDAGRAAQARRELDRLGVDVQFTHDDRPAPPRAPYSAAQVLGIDPKIIRRDLKRLGIPESSVTRMVLLVLFSLDCCRPTVDEESALSLARLLATQTEDELRARLAQGWGVVGLKTGNGLVLFDVATAYLRLIETLREFDSSGVVAEGASTK